MSIDQELAWFEEHRSELVERYLGKFVVIKDQKLQGSYDTMQAAYEAAVKSFGIEGFAIKQVLPQERIEHIPALWVGAISAAI